MFREFLHENILQMKAIRSLFVCGAHFEIYENYRAILFLFWGLNFHIVLLFFLYARIQTFSRKKREKGAEKNNR